MPTTGSFSGKLVKVFQGDGGGPEVFAAIACLTTNSIDFTSTQLQQACKDSGGWTESAQADKSASVALEFLVKYDATLGIDEIWASYNAGSLDNYQVTTNVTGDPVYSFAGILSQFNENSPVDGFHTCSATILVSGAVTRGTVA